MNTVFDKEQKFEEQVIANLMKCGWGAMPVLDYKTEEELIDNWAEILFLNNNQIDRLNGHRLTKGEMGQILNQINIKKTPYNLNNFINESITITRDCPDDPIHLGQDISLKIYDRKEIAGGQSTYQIARQPNYKASYRLMERDRRGDLMLLINGMPLINIELKRTGVSVYEACSQIETYSEEHIFTGLFSLVQIFVAMTPDETLYFANPGTDGFFNKKYYFHWADFNNDPINDWKKIISTLLSIPMAHQLIGFYTIADGTDQTLKVMRSYQIYAARAISDMVSKNQDWSKGNMLGGYIWHTTGSGKTMTSFKSAQLIANSQDADKVVFLVDRVELGIQSFDNYDKFKTGKETVQNTKNSHDLVKKLKLKKDADNILIITSIQKMSEISKEGAIGPKDLELITSQRIVFIIDECHRSTFGDMLRNIKLTFPKAMYFGFTGTPIQSENQKKENTTSDVFGNELHRYSISDGIRDNNVLGFDLAKVETFNCEELREAVALKQAQATSVEDALADPSSEKAKIFNHFMSNSEVEMTSRNVNGKIVPGIEDFVPSSQYGYMTKHPETVVKNIKSQWLRLSKSGKYHAIFATSCIPEAIDYYRLFKKLCPEIRVTSLFDINTTNKEGTDNDGGYKRYRGEGISIFKSKAIEEIINDYFSRYDEKWINLEKISDVEANKSVYKRDIKKEYDRFKIDVINRFSHKNSCKNLAKEDYIDIVIVVDQLLTGFDSKWINTIYLDKVLRYENLIQTFSRTNRLYDKEKTCGIIRYYRKPYTMQKNIDKAVKLYSGDKVFGLFIDKLGKNVKKLNNLFEEISDVFKNANIQNFEKNPEDEPSRNKFIKLFSQLRTILESAKVQGFDFSQDTYVISEENNQEVKLTFDEHTYKVLLKRYKELFTHILVGFDRDPYAIDTSISVSNDSIDIKYMNEQFVIYKKNLEQKNISNEELENSINELHKQFAFLSQEQQKYANIFLQDIQSGNVELEPNKTFMDYVTEYQSRYQNSLIKEVIEGLGVDEKLLRDMITLRLTSENLNEYGRFDALRNSVDKDKAKQYFDNLEKDKKISKPLPIKIKVLLSNFILSSGTKIEY